MATSANYPDLYGKKALPAMSKKKKKVAKKKAKKKSY